MANPAQSKILVVEDEIDIRDLISLHLRRDGHSLVEASTGEEATKCLEKDTFDLVVLDWMLPGMSGIEITQLLRSKQTKSSPPILMVTAKAEANDIVEGLEKGADDYLTKPFEPAILQARVRALLRRSKPLSEPVSNDDQLVFGELTIRPEFHEVKCENQEIELTHSEFKLLLALAQNAGKVLTRNQLISQVQGAGIVVIDRTVDTHIFGLRKKLGACSSIVETIRGVGYRIRSKD